MESQIQDQISRISDEDFYKSCPKFDLTCLLAREGPHRRKIFTELRYLGQKMKATRKRKRMELVIKNKAQPGEFNFKKFPDSNTLKSLDNDNENVHHLNIRSGYCTGFTPCTGTTLNPHQNGFAKRRR